MIGGAILSLLLIFCCWRICHSSGNNTYPAPQSDRGTLPNTRPIPLNIFILMYVHI
jgi:hypothetical protein